MSDENVTTEAPEKTAAEQIEERVEEIQREAKEKFSLRERLSGFKGRRRTVKLYLDLEGMDDLARLKQEADIAFARAEAIEGTEPEVQEQRTKLLDLHNEALDAYEAAREEYARTSVAVAHIKTIADPQTQRAGRRARRRIEGLSAVMGERVADETLTEEQRDDAREWLLDSEAHLQTEAAIQSLVLGGLEKLVFADHTMYEADIDADAVRALQEILPSAQWQELTGTFETLLFEERVARSAVGEPGF